MSLRSLLQTLCCGALRLTLLPALIRWRMRDRVTVINYHNPRPEVFERHVRAFRRCYELIGLDQVVTAMENGTFADLPRRSLVITIDDGYEGVAKLEPTLRKYGLKVTVYVVAGLVDSGRRLWWEVVPNARELQRLKELPDADRRASLRELYGHFDEREYAHGDVLSQSSLKRLMAHGTTIGSHTVFHPLLPQCATDVAFRELSEGRQMLEQITGTAVQHFAYPGGAWDGRIRELAAKCGYLSARTIDPGWVTGGTDPLAMPCFGISDDASVSKALVQASGMWTFARSFTASNRKSEPQSAARYAGAGR